MSELEIICRVDDVAEYPATARQLFFVTPKLRPEIKEWLDRHVGETWRCSMIGLGSNIRVIFPEENRAEAALFKLMYGQSNITAI